MNGEQLPIAATNDAGSVPVFDCRVIVTPLDNLGKVRLRSANLEGLQLEASSERDGLRAIVGQFKLRLAEYQRAGQPIPWKEPAEEPGPGESLRWIPVHL